MLAALLGEDGEGDERANRHPDNLSAIASPKPLNTSPELPPKFAECSLGESGVSTVLADYHSRSITGEPYSTDQTSQSYKLIHMYLR